jgi:hypothetical protein
MEGPLILVQTNFSRKKIGVVYDNIETEKS